MVDWSSLVQYSTPSLIFLVRRTRKSDSLGRDQAQCSVPNLLGVLVTCKVLKGLFPLLTGPTWPPFRAAWSVGPARRRHRRRLVALDRLRWARGYAARRATLHVAIYHYW